MAVFVSVIIPVYNERAYVEEILLRVQAAALEKEILIVDDGSTDGTRVLLQGFEKARAAGHMEIPVQNGGALLALQNIRFFFQDRNQGKGARCAGASKLRAAISFSFRMPIWSTTLGTIRSCSSPFLTDGRTSFTVRAFWEGRSACTTSGITRGTNS